MKHATNYRKQYEKLCKIKIPKGYEIHHINLNHEDNKIENLDNILSIQINDSQTSEYIEVEVTYEMLENIGTKEKIVF